MGRSERSEREHLESNQNRRSTEVATKSNNIGKEFWKTYGVATGTSGAYGKLMASSPDFRGSGVQFLVIGSSQIQFYGLPADHADVENVLKMAPEFWLGVQKSLANCESQAQYLPQKTMATVFGAAECPFASIWANFPVLPAGSGFWGMALQRLKITANPTIRLARV